MARQVTVRAFEEWIKDAANVERVLELIAGGKTLQKAALAVKQPYTCLHPFFHDGAEMEKKYGAARKAWVDFKNDELVAKVEAVKPDRDHVAKLKLESDVIANQSKAYHRERWGERLQVEKNVNVSADAALIGTVAQLLLSGRKRPGVTIDAPGQVSDAEPPAARLPAPAGLD